MKKIFRKNQLVITALALMIAVAGYFSYMNNNMDETSDSGGGGKRRGECRGTGRGLRHFG